MEEKMTSEKFEVLRIWAEALYDHQDVRMRSMNRVRNLIRRKLLELGFAPENKKEEATENYETLWDDKQMLALLEQAQTENKLSEADYSFLTKSFELANNESSVEKEYEKQLNPLITAEPIWTAWLQYVKGISTKNTTRLLRYFGYCENFDTVSKLWAYSGLAVRDGKAIKRTKGEKLPYNLKIKTGVVGVIGKNLILANASYKKFYDTYKARIQERGCCDQPYKGSLKAKKGKACKDFPNHRANMANRAMVKLFLQHYWTTTRTIKGLPTDSPWIIGKDNHQHTIKPYFDKKVEET